MTQPFSNSAAERNKTPIFERLAPVLADVDSVLEIGSGDGTHARHAVQCLPKLRWQTSEQPERVAHLDRCLDQSPVLAAPLPLDVSGPWPHGPFGAVYAANVTHIMAWPEVVMLIDRSAAILEQGGLLCLYGPFFDDDLATAPSNLSFDQRLRDMQSTMGLRRLQAVQELAARNNLRQRHDWLMPANNRLLVWQKPGDSGF